MWVSSVQRTDSIHTNVLQKDQHSKPGQHPSPRMVTMFSLFFVFKTYSLSSFQIHNTVLLTVHTVPYIPRILYLTAGSLYLLNCLHPFLPAAPTPAPPGEAEWIRLYCMWQGRYCFMYPRTPQVASNFSAFTALWYLRTTSLFSHHFQS